MSTSNLTKTSPRDLWRLIVALALPLLVGGLGGWVTAGPVQTWYPTMIKPSWNPPPWLFAPVWTALYFLMGWAAWRIWRLGLDQPAVRRALAFFGLQLAFNLGWSLLFFGLQRTDLALLEIGVLLALIIVTFVRFRALDRLAGWLLVPYLLWTMFATALNAAVWGLNR
ncbi:MAG TPA: TspO/MBR family protein [Anaerolineales bacterium]|jgi:tryptophan-rich sensory protein